MTVPDRPHDRVASLTPAAVSAAIVVGLIAAAGAPAGPRPSPQCPGLLDLVAMAAASVVSGAAPGPWFRVVDALLAVAVAALVARVSTRAGSDWPVAVAAGVAAGMLASVSPSPFAAACGLILASWIAIDGRSPRAAPMHAGVTLGGSVIAPGGALLLAVAGALVARDTTGGRSRKSLLAVAAAIPLSLAVLMLAQGATSAIASCALPVATPAGRGVFRSGLGLTLATGGLYLSALAALGGLVVAMTTRLRSRHTVATVVVGVGSIFAGLERIPSVPPGLAVALTLLAAVGAGHLLKSLHARRALRAFATVVFAGLLPLPAFLASVQDRPAAEDPGHGSLSLERLSARLALAPADAVLVEEDAHVSVLLRAAWFDGRTMPATVPLIPTAITAARGAGPVLALPYGQQYLKNRGFRLDSVPGAPGLSTVEPLGPCRALLAGWRRLADLEQVDMFAFVADRREDLGPVTFYALFDAAPELYSLDWPAEAIAGFRWTRYAPGDSRLQDAVNFEQVPTGVLPLDRLFGFRLDLRRSPGSPLALATTFHRRPLAVFGRLDPAARGQRLSACPASTHDLEDFDLD